MGTYGLYAIDDSIEPLEDVEDTEADESGAEEEVDDADDDDADYVPRTVATPKRRRRVGTVSLDATGRLAVLAAEPGDEQEVKSAVDHMNGRPTLFLKLPPEAGDEHFALVKLPVTRGEPRFFEALQDNLQRWHGMELEPETSQ